MATIHVFCCGSLYYVNLPLSVQVWRLKEGDIVLTPSVNHQPKSTARICRVYRRPSLNALWHLVPVAGFHMSRRHPIMMNNKWVMPIEVFKTEPVIVDGKLLEVIRTGDRDAVAEACLYVLGANGFGAFVTKAQFDSIPKGNSF